VVTQIFCFKDTVGSKNDEFLLITVNKFSVPKGNALSKYPFCVKDIYSEAL